MIKTYRSRDGIIFKGLQYTGKNIEEFYKQVNDPNNEMGIRVQTGMTSPSKWIPKILQRISQIR